VHGRQVPFRLAKHQAWGGRWHGFGVGLNSQDCDRNASTSAVPTDSPWARRWATSADSRGLKAPAWMRHDCKQACVARALWRRKKAPNMHEMSRRRLRAVRSAPKDTCWARPAAGRF